jgi:DNA replication protein DnaC
MTDRDDGDDGPRDDNGDRLPVAVDMRSGGGTLADILAETNRLLVGSHEAHERRAAELEKHRVECTADECRMCERSKCYRCGALMQGLTGPCEQCRDRERFERAKARVFATIPKRFRWAIDCNLATLAERVKLPPDRISGAIAWAASLEYIPPSLALTGVTGAGKTSLAVALFATWFAKHRNEKARFVPAIELGLARMRHPLGHDDPPAIIAAMEAPLLILDDLGAEAPMHADVVRQVLHQRHNDDLPTWVTSGLTHAELARRFDGGLARRIFEESKQVALGLP